MSTLANDSPGNEERMEHLRSTGLKKILKINIAYFKNHPRN